MFRFITITFNLFTEVSSQNEIRVSFPWICVAEIQQFYSAIYIKVFITIIFSSPLKYIFIVLLLPKPTNAPNYEEEGTTQNYGHCRPTNW